MRQAGDVALALRVWRDLSVTWGLEPSEAMFVEVRDGETTA